MTNSPPVDRIEIYSDATWLEGQPRNPSTVGGWGAVVLEYRGDQCTPRILSGHTGDEIDSSTKAEVYGAYMALQDVSRDFDLSGATPLPKIALYVDQIELVKELKVLGRNIKHQAHRNLKALGASAQELAALVRSMDASVEYMEGSHARVQDMKTPEDCAAKAHALAREEAWRSRLKKQGYILIVKVKGYRGFLL